MWEIWRCIFSLIFCECKYIVTCYVLCILALLYLMGLISVFFLQVKVSRSDSSQLTAEERRNLVTITAQQSDLLFHHSSLSHLENEATEERNLTVHVLNYTVPENGVIDVEFPILSDTKTLRVQVLLCKVLLGSVDTLNCVGWDQWWAVCYLQQLPCHLLLCLLLYVTAGKKVRTPVKWDLIIAPWYQRKKIPDTQSTKWTFAKATMLL